MNERSEDYDPSTCMRRVGVVLPGGPAGLGDIWVSESTIALLGEQEVRRQVRAIFGAAYAHEARMKKPPAPEGAGGQSR